MIEAFSADKYITKDLDRKLSVISRRCNISLDELQDWSVLAVIRAYGLLVEV